MTSQVGSRALGAFCMGIAVALQEIDLLPPETRSSKAVLETLEDFFQKTSLGGQDRKELDAVRDVLRDAMKTPLVASPHDQR